MSKKLLMAVLAGALSVSMLAACGGEGIEEDPGLGDEPAADMEDDGGEEDLGGE